MSKALDDAITSLEDELQSISMRTIEVKKTINQLLFLNGKTPKYTDIDFDGGTAKTDVEPRQFVGKEMIDAVKEFMKMRGKKASSAQEILEALKSGDFSFPSEWKKKLMLKNMAIFLGSTKDVIVSFDTKDGKVYALAEHYPERKRELDKQAKSKSGNQEESNGELKEEKK
jgi:hypothetical protein